VLRALAELDMAGCVRRRRIIIKRHREMDQREASLRRSRERLRNEEKGKERERVYLERVGRAEH
jgi:hypothetical protein